MKTRAIVLWLGAAAFAAGCTFGDLADYPVAGEVPAEAGAETGAGSVTPPAPASTTCSVDADCTASLPKNATPAGCAVATCDHVTGACSYHAHDGDGDGHYAMGCTGPGITPGDDCDDANPSVHPGAWDGPAGDLRKSQFFACDGKDDDCNGMADDSTLADGSSCVCAIGTTQTCSQDAQGKAIQYPGGTPAAGSICTLGMQTCIEKDGGPGQWGPCVGAVGPAARDCTSAKDNDCDGKLDNTHDTTCQCQASDPNTCVGGPNNCPGTQTCNITAASSAWSACTAPANCTCTNNDVKSCGAVKGAKGTCAGGSSTCVAGLWGTCSVQPAGNDTCDPGNDNTCNGLPNEGCICINGTSSSCGSTLGARGRCSGGSSTCTNGHWGSCSIQPAGADTCDLGDDSTCDGNANGGCVCINGRTQGCLVGNCGGVQSCSGGNWGACAQTQAPSGLNGQSGAYSCTSNCNSALAACTANQGSYQCGPNAFGTTRETDGADCPGGYHVTNCQCVLDPIQSGGTCTPTVSGNHCHLHQGTSSGQTQIANLVTTCHLN